MKKSPIIRILVKGGILTPRFMQQINEAAKRCGNKTISFGSRQDILFKVPRDKVQSTSKYLLENNIPYEWKSEDKIKSQNIVSSYVATDILKGTAWVNSSTYIQILEQFPEKSKVRINLVDPKQKLVPLFSGNLNFVASETENYWHLFIKKSGSNKLHEWSALIYGPQIHLLCHFLEPYLLTQEVNIQEWFHLINDAIELNSQNKKKNIEITSEFAPYYEGINPMEGRKDFWAGFYWRNNEYTIEFLNYVCELCLRTKIAKISITPWKSFLVKNIQASDKIHWEQLVGIFGINMRHASLDMFWHLPYGSKTAYALKNRLVKRLNKIDIRTYGLTYSIGMPEVPFTSIVIKSSPGIKFLGKLNIFKTYEVWYALDFNPETNKYIIHAAGLEASEIPKALIELSKKFYLRLQESSTELIPEKKEDKEILEVQQCKDCLNIYVEALGDELKQIKPNTPFSELPDNYCCSTCESSKEAFVTTSINKEMIYAN